MPGFPQTENEMLISRMMRGKDMDKQIATPITEEVTRDLKD